MTGKRTLVSVVTLATTLVLSVAYPAAAVTGSASRNLDARVQGVLRHNVGSSRLSADTVQLASGARMRLTTSARPMSVSGECPGGWLCLFQDSNFDGAVLELSGCSKVNLYKQYLDSGRSWADQTSSIDNPGPHSGVSTPGTAHFYNYQGSGDPMNLANDAKVLDLADGHYLRNLAKDASQDGGKANDKIDIVVPC